MKPILTIVFLLILAAGLHAAQAPSVITLNNGTKLQGTVKKIEGSDVYFMSNQDGELVTINMSDINSESKKEIYSWALPLILANAGQFGVKTLKRIEIQDEEDGFFYECSLSNNSPMHLPEDLEIQYNVHVLSFGAKPIDGKPDNYRYELTNTETTSYLINPKAISAKNSRLFRTHHVQKLSDDYILNGKKVEVAPFNATWFELKGQQFYYKDVKSGRSYPPQVYKYVLELRFLHDHKLIQRIVDLTEALDFIQDAWEDPLQVFQQPMPYGDNTKPDGDDTKEDPLASLTRSSNSDALDEPDYFTPDVDKPEQPLNISYDTIAIINIDDGTATGFLVELKGKKFLATNIHVVAGSTKIDCKTTSGNPIKLPDSFYIAEDRDLAIFPIDYYGDFLKSAENLKDKVKVGEKVTVFGNEAGASVVTEITGKIDGIGPVRIETDAKFVEGNSGSPVIHHGTTQVVGIAAYYIEYEIPEADKKDSDPRFGMPDQGDPRDQREYPPEAYTDPRRGEPTPKPTKERRRFAERLDNVTDWQLVQLTTLLNQQKAIDQYSRYVEGIAQIAVIIANEKRMARPGEVDSEFNYLLEDFHKIYSNTRQANSSGNERALDTLKVRIVRQLDRVRDLAQRAIKNGYFEIEFERIDAFDQSVRDYLEGVYTY